MRAVGVDVRGDAIADCKAMAEGLEWLPDGAATFLEGDMRNIDRVVRRTGTAMQFGGVFSSIPFGDLELYDVAADGRAQMYALSWGG